MKSDVASLAGIETLVNKFLDKTLPASEWTHAAHLTVGFYFVAKHGPARAMEMMRECIFTYNESVGTINSDSSGYHETITRFWIWLLNAYWEQVPDKSRLADALNAFLQSEYAKKDVFFKFYRRELLFSAKARRFYVGPDLMPLNVALISEK